MSSLLLTPTPSSTVINNISPIITRSYIWCCERKHEDTQNQNPNHHQAEEQVDIRFNEMLRYKHADADHNSSADVDRASSSAGYNSTSTASVSDYHPRRPTEQVKELVAECGLAILEHRWQTAIHLINVLNQQGKPDDKGEATERTLSHFVRALARKVVDALGADAARSSGLKIISGTEPHVADEERLQSACLAFNQATPFMLFAHLTANQYILETVLGGDGHWESVHIVDVDIMQGVQWPPLMQALADRGVAATTRLCITGGGPNPVVLQQTGERLTRFAASLGLRGFQFRPLHYKSSNMEDVVTNPSEALVINCMVVQGRDGAPSLRDLLKWRRPAIITLAEPASSGIAEECCQRVMDAFTHMSGIFESLEATLPPSSPQRLSIESVWLAAQIQSMLDQSCASTWTRHVLPSLGFRSVPLSEFALSQARLLLRLRYPCEGYQLMSDDEQPRSLLQLGWQRSPLFTVSAWQ